MALFGATLNILLLLTCRVATQSLPASYRPSFDPIPLLLDNCNLHPSNANSPDEFDNQATHVNLILKVDRFLSISDVDESFSFMGGLAAGWQVPCVRDLVKNSGGSWPGDIMHMEHIDSNALWTPPLVHRNSINQMAMEAGQFYRMMSVNFTTGEFALSYLGRFDSYWNLDYYSWPFDQQTVELIFGTRSDMRYLKIVAGQILAQGELFMPYNSNWKLLNSSYTIETDSLPTLGTITQIRCKLVMKRLPEYFLINLFGPCFILSVLELSSFAIPPDGPDRPAYAITIMLSIFVLQSQFTTYVPSSPKLIVSGYYVLGVILYSTMCVLEASMMLWYIHTKPKKAKAPIVFCGKHMETYEMIDKVAFVISFIALIAFNVGTVGFLAMA